MSAALPGSLQPVLAALLAQSRPGEALALDVVGDAVGSLAVSAADIEALFDALAARGRDVAAPAGNAARDLGAALAAARALRGELGRTPTPDEVAARAGLAPGRTRAALGFGRVLGR